MQFTTALRVQGVPAANVSHNHLLHDHYSQMSITVILIRILAFMLIFMKNYGFIHEIFILPKQFLAIYLKQ